MMEIDQYVEELAAEEGKLRMLREQIRVLRQEESDQVAVVEGWRAILRGRGWTPQEIPNSDVTEQGVASFVQNFIETRGEKGVIPKELLAEARVRNLRPHSNFPYCELGRMTRKGLLIKEGNRYYSTIAHGRKVGA